MSDQIGTGSPRRGSVEWWQATLIRLNDLFVNAPWLVDSREYDVPPEDLDRGWLGRPGATESELDDLERRLGRRLCPSYRALLQASNGFARFGRFVGRLLPSREVDWYPNRNPGIRRAIEEWLGAGNPVKPPYAEEPAWREDIPLRSVEITQNVEGYTLVLHPDETNVDGEWEVWLLMIGNYTRYENLPDYIDDAIERLGPRTSAFGPIVY
jgi:hypothetical protein